MKTKKQKQSFFPILLTVLIDMIGIGIVIPIFAPMFLAANSSLLPATYSISEKSIMLGFLLASYPLALFFGAPIIGAISDHHGRKKVIIISLIFTCIGYILTGIGVLNANLVLVFIGRIVSGFTGGNIATAMSAIADLSDKKSKAKNFGMIGGLFGLGLILGPFIGGKLADPTVVSWFNFATPFWFAAAITLINMILVILIFKETLSEKLRIKSKISLLTGVRNIKKAANMPSLKIIFIVSFLYTFGFNFYTQFFQVYLIEKFNYGPSQIGNIFAFVGIWIVFTQLVLIGPVTKKFSPKKILSVCMILASIVLLIILIPDNPYWLYLIIPFFAIFQGMIWPNFTSIVSNLGDPRSQGEILGINQSIQALAAAIPPILAGFFAAMNVTLPIIIASSFAFLAWFIFILFFKSNNNEKFKKE